MAIERIINWINVAFGVIGLLLVARFIVLWFNVPSGKAMRLLLAITDPMLKPVRRWLGGNSYTAAGSGYVDMAVVVTLLAIFLLRSVLIGILSFIDAPQNWLARLRNLEWTLVKIIHMIFTLYNLALLIRVILSWIQSGYYTNPFVSFIYKITDPVLQPLRRQIPTFGGLDFSPLIAFFLLSLLERVITSFVVWIF